MEKLFKIVPPSMPDFVWFEKELIPRQEGFKVDKGFDIKNFSEEEAKEFAELMRTTFLEHWEKRKKIVFRG